MVPGATVLSLEQTMEIVGCGRSKVFELLAQGILEQAPRYGRNIRIYRDSVERALARPKRRGRKPRTPSASACGFDLEDIPIFQRE